jgi:hypothetical protein
VLGGEGKKEGLAGKLSSKEKRVFLHLVCVFASTTSVETCNKLFPMHFWILGFAAITFLLPMASRLQAFC